MGKNFIIGIDLGGTNTKIGLLDKCLNIKDRVVFSTKEFKTKNLLIEALCLNITCLLDKHGIKKSSVLGIGIGLPGPIDSARGIAHYFPNIPGWREVPLSGIIRRKTGISTLIDNDVNLIALAEFKKGAGIGAVNMLCLTLGTGVGAGIILGGRLYRGSSFSAGEVGHVPVNEFGPKCGCGSNGCLESYIGNQHILNLAQKSLKIKNLEELTVLARKGNKEALSIWHRVGRFLGIALSGVVNLLNPDLIVIGGGVSGAGSFIFGATRKVIKARAMSPAKTIAKIARAKLGDDAGIIGAALLLSENKC
ncbi:MAG: sugar kinase [Candidatus Omnitrophica bacterium CG11_big_fil_rev_8_21_14_0_20_42_13]|uniref:Sugar kinase n=1 Tax=Candidatus Ghiorseimicrobium undicola TaxID=1974746 RepID=A0A2H0LWL8_9BACT|nr:MAG: sugar kinase [Candidatus Omnitrophica bacterium CG11_big_fil_rev_8_21_14_0_20_42_13]